MYQELTTPQLQDIANHFITRRLTDSAAPIFTQIPPRLTGCDGPSRTVELAYDTRDWMTNPLGMVHGGITATILDTSMGITCSCFYGQPTPTITMTINYARPVPLNAAIVVRSRIVVHGRTSAQLTAELFLPDRPDRILATATGVYHTRTACETVNP